jgi:nicotinate-nucleotide pyrophosphorylase (carboxylating)
MDFQRKLKIRRAYDRLFFLSMRNPLYVESVKAIIGGLLKEDVGAGDVTTNTLFSGEGQRKVKAKIFAKEDGVLAGGDEFLWLYAENKIEAKRMKRDGEKFAKGEVLFKVSGPERDILCLERTGLNLLQRMSGIATETKRLAEKIKHRGFETAVTATRKTPWGYLDKRAVSLGSGFSHRLGLHESILVKDNHLASLKKMGIKNPIAFAINKTTEKNVRTVFIEIEVKNEKEAMAAARKFKKIVEQTHERKPFILMLDNVAPREAKKIVGLLKKKGLHESVLVEASGGVNGENILEYAKAGVDACSLGRLTHSAKALDISQKIV